MYESFGEISDVEIKKKNLEEKPEKIYCENCSFFVNWACGCYYFKSSPSRKMTIRLDNYEENKNNNCKYFQKVKRTIFGIKLTETKHIEELDEI